LPSEHQFTRPDARPQVKTPPPSWMGEALAWPLLLGILATVIAFFLFTFAPAIVMRDMNVNFVMMYFSIPVAAILAPVTGWVVCRLLRSSIERDLARDVPSRGLVNFKIFFVFAILAVAAVGTLLAVRAVPNGP
jgi:hypothetical protein